MRFLFCLVAGTDVVLVVRVSVGGGLVYGFLPRARYETENPSARIIPNASNSVHGVKPSSGSEYIMTAFPC